jgi:hypothetical protein
MAFLFIVVIFRDLLYPRVKASEFMIVACRFVTLKNQLERVKIVRAELVEA